MLQSMVGNFPRSNNLPLGQSTKFVTSGASIRLHRTEYIQSVDTVTGFDPYVFQLSLGLSSTFPWLSSIAKCFEYFEMHSLKIHFRSAAPGTWAGKWTIGIDYDAGDLPPVGVLEMGTWEGTVQDNIFNSGTATASPRHLALYKNRMVEASTGSVMNDPRLNSCGTVYVAVQTSTSAVNAGDLYIEYDVTLSSPQMGGPVAGFMNYNQPTAVTSSPKPIPFAGDVVTLAGNLASLIGVSMEGNALKLTAKKPIYGEVNVGVPPTASGSTFPPGIGGTWTKGYDAASSVFYSALEQVATSGTTTKGMNKLILDLKQVGDWVSFTGGTGSNAAWGTDAKPSLTFSELPRSFDPLSIACNGVGAWTKVL